MTKTRTGRNTKCFTIDSDPVYCEIAIRRLERFMQTGKTGWQNSNPFEHEMQTDLQLRHLAGIDDESSVKPVASFSHQD